jgi:hypothetical protein
MSKGNNLIDVDSLELAYPHFAYRLVHPTLKGDSPAESLVKDGKDQSFMADKSIISFVADVNAATRVDILNSLLLAQLAANHQVPDPNNVMDWYGAYVKIVSGLGWNIQAQKGSTYQANDTLAEVQNVVVDILVSAFGQNYIGIIKDTLKAIGKLADSDGKIQAFDKNTSGNEQGVFQMGMAVEKNGAVALQLGSFMIKTANKTTKILFIKFSKDFTSVDYKTHEATFNPDIYAGLRDQVKFKLGLKASQFVDELVI